MKEALREPDRALNLLMKIFDKLKLETDGAKAEYLRQADGLKNFYALRIEEAVKAENTRLTAVIVEKDAKIEQQEQTIKGLRKQNGELFEENSRANKMNEELKFKNIELERKCDELTAENVRLVSDAAHAQERYDDLEKEKKGLDSLASHLQEQLDLRKRDVFGSSTEQSSRIFNNDKELEDPLVEDAEPDKTSDKEPEKLPKSRFAKRALDLLKPKKGWTERVTRRKGDVHDRYGHLEHRNHYGYTNAYLDQRYGKGNWHIIDFHHRQQLCETRPVVYVMHNYAPIVEYDDPVTGERNTEALPFTMPILGDSYASESMMASVATKLYDLGLPYYRIERGYKSCGVDISRQTMNNWIYQFADETGFRVWERLKKEQLKCPVLQIDETTWRVVVWPKEDDKKNGSLGWLWVHVTSELIGGHKIILYEFTATRGTDHLREYLRNLARYIVSDALSDYSTIENESGGNIRNPKCWMHLRRTFANAVLVMDLDSMTEEQIKENPAVKGLLLSNAIFEADTPLKAMSAAERFEARLVDVKPCVDAFFGFINSFDPDKLSGEFKKAVKYAQNWEKHLKIFLEDASIPIDNGESERRIKPVAILRKNAMFSFSKEGAEINAIMFSLEETAKANGADVYRYFEFLFRESDLAYEHVDDLMPWSTKFKDFATQNVHLDEKIPENEEKPKGKLKPKRRVA